ncbi:MAG TPA: DNA methyltransferase, partial [Chloroflexi bacterium]|nr:DNA methyltransferase [Chloroflexota bacterium]
EDGQRVDNITAYALKQFQEHYKNKTITRLNIFHYVYAVLHHPAYREKYKINLKREFPRIPFYEDFWQWAKWGNALMDLHLNYETLAPYPLQRIDKPPNPDKPPVTPKAKLKADKTAGTIELDTVTTLKGVPAVAWDYKLGNRSALEWVLDRHKERKPRDPTIREKFNAYRFADYKEQVIDLLQRVCAVSVETMKIIDEMSED